MSRRYLTAYRLLDKVLTALSIAAIVLLIGAIDMGAI